MIIPRKRMAVSSLLVLLCIALTVAGCGGTSPGNQSGKKPPARTPTALAFPAPTLPAGFTFPSLKDLYNKLPRLHLFELRGSPVFDRSATAPLIYYHGPVMHTSTTYAIFWEPPRLQDGTPTHVNPTYNSLIERSLKDIGGSPLYKIGTQYYDQTSRIVNSSTFGGAWLDRSAYPASKCRDTYTPHGCLLDTQIQAEVTKAMKVNKWTSSPTHLFFVFTSWGEGSCSDSTSTDCAFSLYCAYHSFYSLGSQNVLYANMPYTGTVLNNCGLPVSPNNDIDADSTITSMSHEHMETVTDPYIDGWRDAHYDEIGDKCAWNFGTPTLDGGLANVEWNHHFYLVQQEWSDAIRGCTLRG